MRIIIVLNVLLLVAWPVRAATTDRADTGVEDAGRMVAAIDAAIEKGVPLFNGGDHAACAAIYEKTATGLKATAGSMDPIARAVLDASIEAASAMDDAAGRAWALRSALDVARAFAHAGATESDAESISRRVTALAASVDPIRRLAIGGGDTMLLDAMRAMHDRVADRDDLARVLKRTIASVESTDRMSTRMMRASVGLNEAKIAANFKPVIEADLPVGYPAPGPVGAVVLKEYPAYRAAWASGSRDNGTFMTLFNHIKRNDIAMTAPVEMTMDDTGRSMRAMAFLYGDTDWGRLGSDGRVQVRDMKPATFVSIGVRGSMNAAQRAAAVTKLRQRIAAGGLEEAGPVRVLGYNSPFIPDAMKYSEVQIPVTEAADAAEPR